MLLEGEAVTRQQRGVGVRGDRRGRHRRHHVRYADARSEPRLLERGAHLADTVEQAAGQPRARLNYGVILYTGARSGSRAATARGGAPEGHQRAGPRESRIACSARSAWTRACRTWSGRWRWIPEYRAVYSDLGGRPTAAPAGGHLPPGTSRSRSRRRPTRRSCSNRLGWLLATSPEDACGTAEAVEVQRSAPCASRRGRTRCRSRRWPRCTRKPAASTRRSRRSRGGRSAERIGNPAAVARMSARLSQYERHEKVRQ